MPKNKIEKKLFIRERYYDKAQRMKIKRSEEYEVLEEVFDKPTLMTIYHLMNQKVIDKLHGAVKSGKESKIFWAIAPSGAELAVKIYLTVSAEFRKGMLPYLAGDPRFKRVKSGKPLIYTWAEKEFKNLKIALKAGVRVPTPYAVRNNVLVMEFIGEKGVPSPLLKDLPPPSPQESYLKLLEYVKLLYSKGNLVHGDLSEYNVMIHRGEPVLFDVSQAVLLSHPLADQLLRRDIRNLNQFFRKLGVKIQDEEKIYEWVVGNGSSA
ncbi:serine protein kinase RIO [Candidatus Hecatella orcuttiae]|uniref:serine protein kinase RIO n=1 Tax=Candidatus Hecatella orcuttiae TaxID=1935119 RepID=UPI002867C7A5|nr:serine protein kinase RIO [Candidatus Hecatella orcuttiae]